ncbi:MAG: Septum formation protein Maf [Chlorobi bacterium]|nr:Septum formation protein Maf [Chlorobiota bacterium]
MSFLPFVILASSSPRRQQLMRQMGAEFIVIRPDADETTLEGESPEALVERLSLEKALAITHDRDAGVILGSDTVVVLDGDILGKPASAEDARRMLRQLSGKTHTVFTGFALVDIASGVNHMDHERTDVTFRKLEEEEIVRYVATGSPLDKAGAYGIQDDFGAVFIERIVGDYYTVVGLPLTKVYMALRGLSSSSSGDV